MARKCASTGSDFSGGFTRHAHTYIHRVAVVVVVVNNVVVVVVVTLRKNIISH